MEKTAGNYAFPDEKGRFGEFGGRYVSETLMPALIELAGAYGEASPDPTFRGEIDRYLDEYVGRPTPLYFARAMTEKLGGAKIYLKREDLAHTGAHKINNTIGQAVLARRMNKRRIIAETGAGQHGVATATVAALLDSECVVYMGEEDIGRQQLNVFRMKLLGAEVRPVASGTATLKDAMNEAMRDWVTNVRDTFYIIGSVAGPHPYPLMVRDFQSVIGREAREQALALEGRLPDVLVACVGGGSNAMGLFFPFMEDGAVRKIGVEAAGHGLETGKSLCHHNRGVRRGSSRKQDLSAPGRGRAGEGSSLRGRGSRLPGGGSGALPLSRNGNGGVRFGDRRGGAFGLFLSLGNRRDNPGARDRPRRRPREKNSSFHVPRQRDRGMSFGKGGQGHNRGFGTSVRTPRAGFPAASAAPFPA